MIQKVGNNSMIFEKPPVILAASSVVGEKEGQGPLGQYFDHVEKDPKFGMETWEQAESTMPVSYTHLSHLSHVVFSLFLLRWDYKKCLDCLLYTSSQPDCQGKY